MPIGVHVKIVRVAPVKRQYGIGLILPVRELPSTRVRIILYLVLHHGTWSNRVYLYGSRSIWHPVVLPVVDQLVVVYGRIPTVYSFLVQPIMIIDLTAQILDLV